MARSLITFDLPGYPITCGTSIASNGLIAGTANLGQDTVGTETSGKARPDSKAFVYINGRFSFPKPDVPAGVITFTGINSRETIIGFDSPNAPSIPFIFADHVTTLPSLDQGNGAQFVAIDDKDTMLGYAIFPNLGPMFQNVFAFIQKKSGALTILNDGTGQMTPTGFDSTAERVVGTSQVNSIAWTYYACTFATLAMPGALFTLPAAVDSTGKVAGSYLTGPVSSLVSHGFIWKNGRFATWDVPGAMSTTIRAANEAGQFTGCYTDGQGTHGFVASP